MNKKPCNFISSLTLYRGRAWRFGDNIDTDQIYPGKFLPLTDKTEMARHAMEGTDRGEEFREDVKPGDILVAGKNFGCGSSREHAAIAIKGAGISVVVAESFARIFHRNCINTGLPAIELKDAKEINDGDVLEIDIVLGIVKNITQNKIYRIPPISQLEKEILNAGGLLNYLKLKEENNLGK